jgi:hypothetical protein
MSARDGMRLDLTPATLQKSMPIYQAEAFFARKQSARRSGSASVRRLPHRAASDTLGELYADIASRLPIGSNMCPSRSCCGQLIER